MEQEFRRNLIQILGVIAALPIICYVFELDLLHVLNSSVGLGVLGVGLGMIVFGSTHDDKKTAKRHNRGPLKTFLEKGFTAYPTGLYGGMMNNYFVHVAYDASTDEYIGYVYFRAPQHPNGTLSSKKRKKLRKKYGTEGVSFHPDHIAKRWKVQEKFFGFVLLPTYETMSEDLEGMIQLLDKLGLEPLELVQYHQTLVSQYKKVDKVDMGFPQTA